MGFFNFIESFFFISLAITFVLIMMIIYHFKERITGMEKKTETTVEIVNHLAKEMTALRGFVIHNLSMGPSAVVGGEGNTSGNSPAIFQVFSENMGNIGHFFKSQLNLDENNDDDDAVIVEHLKIGEDLSDSMVIEGTEDTEDEDEDEDEDAKDEDDDEDEDAKDEDAKGEDTEDTEDVIHTEVEIEKVVVVDDPLPTSEESAHLDNIEEVASELNMVPSPTPATEDYTKLTTTQLKNIVLDKKMHKGNVNKLKRHELLHLLQTPPVQILE
jgi:hypothetical protein